MQTPQDQPSQNLPALTDSALPVRQERGGVVGNKGGLGRVPTRVRREARESFYRLIPRFAAIANGEKVKQTVVAVNPLTNDVVTGEADVIPKLADQWKAWDALGKYGLGENVSTEDVRARLLTQCAVIREELGLELGERLIERLSKVWR